METLTINKVEIPFCIKGDDVFVPIKPVCELLGIDHSAQVASINDHPILGSVMVLNTTTGKDGKTYQMQTLPLKYFFAWLLGIDARRVKPEAAQGILDYQEKVYSLVYEKFCLEPIQQKKKLIQILEKEKKVLVLKMERKELNAQIKTVEQQIEEIKATDPAQLTLSLAVANP